MEEGDVPPLEDMSEYVQQLRQKSKATTLAPGDEPAKHVDTSLLELELPSERRDNGRLLIRGGDDESVKVSSAVMQDPSATKDIPGTTSKAAVSFGGMKKGFLFGGGSADKGAIKKTEGSTEQDESGADLPGKKSRQVTATSPKITVLKPGRKSGAAAANSLRLEEVQEEMRRSQPLLASQDWITEDLLRRIKESPVLSKAFQDPTMMRVMAEFQRNPQEALRAAQDQPELLQFLKEFSSLMGEHFTSLSTTKYNGGSNKEELISVAVSPEEEARLKALLCKPEVQNAMKDPRIQRLIELLKSDPEEAQKLFWANREPDFHSKVTVLLENQVLSIQT